MNEKLEKLKKLKELETPWNNPGDGDLDIFKDLQESKVVSLKEIIKEIQDLIKERQELSKKASQAAEKAKIKVNNFILEAGEETKFSDKAILRQKQAEIEQFKIKETLDCWKDIARLKEELRAHLKDARDKEIRMKAINDILD